jgi:monooxygenase
LNYMDRHAYTQCTPRLQDNTFTEEQEPIMGLTSGYMQRARDSMPRQSSRKPWKMHQNYLRDVLSLRFSMLKDGAMEFTRRADHARQNTPVGKG